MKRKSRKLCSLIVASSMVLSMSVSPVFGAQFEDTADHWASKQINTWSDYGVINGYEGLFRPNDPITRGEMAVIMNNIMQYRVKGTNTFKDLDYGFYRDAILKASNAGVMNGSDGLVRPKDNITREESAILICNTMGIDSSDSSSQTFDDSGDISSWAKPYVNALLNKGYISGKGDNNFDPQGYITRGETVTILDNIVKGFYNSAGTYTQNADGTVVVNSADAVLKNMNITGDLIISEGVGDGDIILEDVTLGGALIVRGGGENSIHFRGSKTQIPNVKMEKKDGNVRLATDGQAKVGNVLVKDKSKEVKLEGTFTSVNVSSTNIVRVQKANITKLSVDTEKANVRVDSNSTVETLEVPANAESSELYIEGNVKNLQTLAKSVKLQTTTSSIIETLTVSESASNADINLGGKVTNTNIGASGIKFVVNKSAVMTNITVSVSVVGINFEIIGTITTLTTHGTDIKINVASTGTISTITASESSSNITVSGSGKVEQIYANGNNITITTGGTQVTTGSNATGVVVNNVKVESNKTIVTTGQNGGITNPTDNNSSSSGDTDIAAGAKRIIAEITNNPSAFTNVRLNDNVLDIAKAQASRVSNYADYNIELVEPSANINSNGTAIGIGSASVGFRATHKSNSKNTYATANKITFNISPQENAKAVAASVTNSSINGFTIELSEPVEGISITIDGRQLTVSEFSTSDNGKTYNVTGTFTPNTTLIVVINKSGYTFNNPLLVPIPNENVETVTANVYDPSTTGFRIELSKPVKEISITINGEPTTSFSTDDNGKTYNVTGNFAPNSELDVVISKAGYTFNSLKVKIPAGETDIKTTANISKIEAINTSTFKITFAEPVAGLLPADITLTPVAGGSAVEIESATPDIDKLTYTIATKTSLVPGQYNVALDSVKYKGTTTGILTVEDNIPEASKVKITLDGIKEDETTVKYTVYDNIVSDAVYESVYLEVDGELPTTVVENGIKITFNVSKLTSSAFTENDLDISKLQFTLTEENGTTSVGTFDVDNNQIIVSIPVGKDFTTGKFILKPTGISGVDNPKFPTGKVHNLTINVEKQTN